MKPNARLKKARTVLARYLASNRRVTHLQYRITVDRLERNIRNAA